MEVDQDHMHCLVKSEPGISPLAIVRRLKQEFYFSALENCFGELMRRICNGISGKNVLFGVTDISAALLVMPVRRPFVTTLPTKAKRQRFIHEAEDLVVFSLSFYKNYL